jgi:hypothetical protein
MSHETTTLMKYIRHMHWKDPSLENPDASPYGGGGGRGGITHRIYLLVNSVLAHIQNVSARGPHTQSLIEKKSPYKTSP